MKQNSETQIEKRGNRWRGGALGGGCPPLEGQKAPRRPSEVIWDAGSPQETCGRICSLKGLRLGLGGLRLRLRLGFGGEVGVGGEVRVGGESLRPT